MTHIIVGLVAYLIANLLIVRWFYLNSERRDPLHDLSDKQADFASVDDDVLIERAVAVYHGGSSK